MTGSQLLKHSFGMIERNIGTAMRISLVLFLVSLALQVGMIVWMGAKAAVVANQGTAISVFASYIPSFTTLFLGAWVAVAWHRFVLLEEHNGGWLPHFHGREVMFYILWIVVLGLIYIVLILPLIFFFVTVAVGVEGGDTFSPATVALLALAGVVTMFVIVVVLSRLSPVLVSRAVSNRLSLTEAWRATRGASKPIIGFMLIMLLFLVVFGVVVSLIVMALKTAGLVLVVPIYLLFTWFLMLLQISYMTTLYGHYVEGRELTL
ncbi:hypothetical protein [Aliiroseovarius sp. 2305UL8-7]|uniref:hypothetical protein n=1 Tax=Aliiroseovarius conchicola TaxID=3121637 RepID=UPI0035283522